eukprot:3938661-Rhodomonas_salina.2
MKVWKVGCVKARDQRTLNEDRLGTFASSKVHLGCSKDWPCTPQTPKQLFSRPKDPVVACLAQNLFSD